MSSEPNALVLSDEKLSLLETTDFAFRRKESKTVEIHETCRKRIRASRRTLENLISEGLPIYGVTTGFGDSCFRVIAKDQTEEMQKNLVSYLLCGTGPTLSVESTRALFLIRLKSLSRGFSGVSEELLDRMRLFLANDWIPVIPREGSLGASGDLIPLAYIAEALQGEGALHPLSENLSGKNRATREVLSEAGVLPYRLKSKEGLALVNGTSVMAGLAIENINAARAILDLATLSTSWLCIALKGRTEAFEVLVNEKANTHEGQKRIAQKIMGLLSEDSYSAKPLREIRIEGSMTTEMVQDRYSLRCTPQVLGPVLETLDQIAAWTETEINGTSDNPLIGEDGSLAMGGNFYGGYLSSGMDYLKISLAHVADLQDRQLMTLIDEKSNRGLPANLANWGEIPENERFLHHGLKALHQSVNAITSEIMAKAIPGGIFSRSSESHNQDKVSLGMSAAVQCSDLIKQLNTIQSMYLICLAQAIDLRKVELKGKSSQALYTLIRSVVPFVKRDIGLGVGIQRLTERLTERAHNGKVL